jgi:hypothetical protein
MSIKVEEDSVFLDTGTLLILLAGKDKSGFEQEGDDLLVYVKPGQRIYVNHPLYYDSTNSELKMELTE